MKKRCLPCWLGAALLASLTAGLGAFAAFEGGVFFYAMALIAAAWIQYAVVDRCDSCRAVPYLCLGPVAWITTTIIGWLGISAIGAAGFFLAIAGRASDPRTAAFLAVLAAFPGAVVGLLVGFTQRWLIRRVRPLPLGWAGRRVVSWTLRASAITFFPAITIEDELFVAVIVGVVTAWLIPSAFDALDLDVPTPS